MLKTIQNTTRYTRLLTLLAALLLRLALPDAAQAQMEAAGFYTLTNGHYYWFDGLESDPDDSKYLTMWDRNGWAQVYKLGTHHGHNVTEIVEQGTVYLKLDISTPTKPKVTSATAFDEYCAWYRTSKVGLYMQEWDGYRYYLHATHNEGLSVYRQVAGGRLQRVTTWNDWDHGAAIEENGSYYWLMYDTLNDADGTRAAECRWRMSEVSCYQRPEEMMVRNYRANGAGGNTWNDAPTVDYYDNVTVGSVHFPAGNAAQFMRLEKKEYAEDAHDYLEGTGLIALLDGSNDAPITTTQTLTYGEAPLTVKPQIVVSGDKVKMEVMPAYTEYVEETYRRGVNLSYSLRSESGFGRGGVATTRTCYYYGSPRNKYNVPPTPTAQETEVETVVYDLDSRGARYLTLTVNPADQSVAVAVTNPPLGSADGRLTCTVKYTNGTQQSLGIDLHIVFTPQRSVLASTTGPAIRGFVVGGGKMANVGGNTSVTVHNADTVEAVYGGNDIAGWVQGEQGATVQVGTVLTSEDHPVHVRYVYGGGCGYYRYGGAYDAAKQQWASNEAKTQNIGYTQYAFRGGVYDWFDPDKVVVAEGTFGYTPYTGDDFATAEDGSQGLVSGKLGGTIPYVKTAHVSIGVKETGVEVQDGQGVHVCDDDGHDAHLHNDYVRVDSLFGGAENAFIGVTTVEGDDYASAITVDINGGTLLTVFGGNNYGGGVAQTSTVALNVHCTKMMQEDDIKANSYYHGYGRDFGIRHLFGGGNLVESTHAEVTFGGGMVDTAFVGGNRASVANPVGVVECRRAGVTADYNFRGWPGFNGHFVYTNPTMTDTANNGRDNEGYVSDNGLFNVRFLYGGNNLAAMNNVSFIQLHSGSVGSVYGGGNRGDMTNTKTVAEAMADHRGYIDIRPLVVTMGSILGGSTMMKVPNNIGAVIAADERSNIIADFVYGGCRAANVSHSCGLYLAGGNYGDIFGGNDVSGDVGSVHDGSTYLVVTGRAVVQGSAYGGSDGYYHCEAVDDEGLNGRYDATPILSTRFNEEVNYDPYDDFVGMLIPTQQHSNVYVNGGLIKGDLVAGGLMANVGFSGDRTPLVRRSGADHDTVLATTERRGTVRLEVGGTAEIRGNVFGGGANASIYGLSLIHVHGQAKILGSLFAGNDCIGQVRSFLPYQGNVDYAGCTTADDSTAAERANQAVQASSNGDRLNKAVEDGSYDPRYSTYVKITEQPVINSVYGSGNGAWDYGNDPLREGRYPKVFVCENRLGETPDQASAYIDINTSGGFIDTVFGGGAGCTVEDELVVLLNNTATENKNYPGASLPSGFKGGRATNFVGTIFGGNNFDDMGTVPDIRLVRGNVKNVYGGGNAGNMEGLTDRYSDICGNTVKNVSTYVLANSTNVTVTDTIFGGSRMSNVKGMAYVDVRQTSAAGIQYLYGGNDISGVISGNTRVDIAKGSVNRVWGGSNGRYDYVPIGDNLYNVYPFKGYDSEHPTVGLITTADQPDVDSTSVNLWGGAIGASVFAGGSMADCRATSLVVDDQVGCSGTGNVTVNGALYGGGEGRWDDLNARDYEQTRWGNVTGSTHVELHHATDVSSAKAYGGGGGGDVQNTYITAFPTWDQRFEAIFGGCWGSDVLGTAHLEFNAKQLTQNLFGGNDFTGNVFRSEIVVNSGTFSNIYGGGNGDYPDSYYTSQHAAALSSTYAYMEASPTAYADDLTDPENPIIRHLERPNSEQIYITFNDGTVYNNFYGGGKLGTTWRYQREEDGSYTLDANSRRVPDTERTTGSAPLDYAYVVANIHGGVINGSLFGGASGRGSNASATGTLVYGFKEVNMDGGHVHQSLYGGSESVDDGYAAECVASNNTTARPSSVVNLTGGTVDGNLYGAGYLGTTYGSVYINVGTDAIDSCVAFSGRNTTASACADGVYSLFKPGAGGSMVPALGSDNVILGHSIYAGANWGSGSGSFDFNTPGFQGGESRIIVDGKDYNTGSDELSSLPQMNIAKSLFGSGTSVSGGDVHSSIDLWNYGVLENCQPSKQLESVQRTKQFFSHNTAVHYLGATDATSAFVSEPYSVLRCETMSFRGFNVAEYDAPVNFVENLYFYEEELSEDKELVLVPVQTLRQTVSNNACGSTATMCGYTSVVNPTAVDKQHTLLLLNNGIDFKIQLDEPPIAENYYTPGNVSGFGYITTPYGYSSSVTALATAYYYDDPNPDVAGVYSWLSDDEDWGGATWDEGFSGFASPCDATNRYTTDRGGFPLEWKKSDEEGYVSNDSEYPYENFIDKELEFLNYREWKVGDGMRLRETAILAHTDPTQLEQDVNINMGGKELALAKASVTLPATSEGHYYRLNSAGITILGSNSAMTLVDKAWYTTTDFETLATQYPADVQAIGELKEVSLTGGGSVLTTEGDILARPNNTFGLLIMPEKNFKTEDNHYVMPVLGTPLDTVLVLSGNSYYNTSNNPFCTPQVREGDRVMPSLQFLLTYSPEITTTFLGTVEFILDEYDAEGNPLEPIRVVAHVSTIVDDFNNLETNVLAMYNNGASNTFTRKVILPITLDENRELYITDISWVPTTSTGTPVETPAEGEDHFYLTETEEQITGATPVTVNNLFGMTLVPNDAVTADMNENAGWTTIDQPSVNVFTLGYPSGSAAQMNTGWDETPDPDTLLSKKLTSLENPNGFRLGVLDGRGSAAIDVNLSFDGSRVYPATPDNGYVGKVVLGMRWVKGNDKGNYKITIYVKTREYGDTIYLASANSVTRTVGGQTITVYPYSDQTHNPHYNGGTPDFQTEDIGKSPSLYVQSFHHALNSNIYEEGDVIAIMDEVTIGNGKAVHIQGADGPPIQVVRYAGSHKELPDEESVYRGPMITVQDGGIFTAQNIDFHGSAGTRVMRIQRDGSGNAALDNGQLQFVSDGSISLGGTSYDVAGTLRPDTNCVQGPVIKVTGIGSTVTLSDGAQVRHNWNGYGYGVAAEDFDASNMGAINVRDGGTLVLKSDVLIADNLSHTFEVDRSGDVAYDALQPGNGAVYVDGGTLKLPASGSITAVDITHNMLMDPAIHDDHSSISWWGMATIGGKASRFTLDTNVVYNNWQRANVFLTRTEPDDGTDAYKIMHDQQSDNILLTGQLGAGTRIGVRKWFPGETMRDTIRFAVTNSSDPTVLRRAISNGNLYSDDGFREFYSQEVNNRAAYFLRCATFRHQWYVDESHEYVDPVHDVDASLTLKANNVLRFGAKENVCPLGGDSIVYSVQGGFMPYTFTWSDPNRGTTLQTNVSPYRNTEVQKDLADETLTAEERYAKYAASMSDVVLLPYEEVNPTTDHKWNHLRVTAVDATGQCTLYKDIDIRIKMDHSATEAVTYLPSTSLADTASYTDNASPWTSTPTDGWTDTARATKAVVSCNFKGVQITPRVWADRSNGTIDAVVAGADNDYVYQYLSESEMHELSELNFCPGDLIYLNTKASIGSTHFVMWDFDPYYRPLALYYVPTEDATVTAYYGPNQYWKQHINSPTVGLVGYDEGYDYTRPNVPNTSTPAGYATTYNGDVHIYNEAGLAWFISTVNGLNGMQARQFYFNKVYLHKKDAVGTPYDMKDYLWTPVGTHNHPFRGWFVGVGHGDTDTARLDGEQVVVKNIIVNEPQMASTGFFGYLDTARVSGIKLQGALVRGSQYVGTLAANAVNVRVDNCAVEEATEGSAITTILTTHYASGGLIGNAAHTKITNAAVAAKYVGDAVYSGGVIGYGVNDTVNNTGARNDIRMSGVYYGGIAGNMTAEDPHIPTLRRLRRTAHARSLIANNHIHILDNGNSENGGGIAGYVENTVMENNYVYGRLGGTMSQGSVAAEVGDGTAATANYAETGLSAQAAGYVSGNGTTGTTAEFKGEGNAVVLDQAVHGTDNLTRALNKWVRQHNAAGGDYRTWRSDLEGDNHGYPLFGQPDLIPVSGGIDTVHGCDEVVWTDGRTYHDGDEVQVHVVDSVEMVDSVATVRFVVHHGTTTTIADSAVMGQAYDGYGFYISRVESMLLESTIRQHGSATITRTDTLTGQYGCDSIVSLTVTFTLSLDNGVATVSSKPAIKVYPNPTTSTVTVETEGLSHVEFYDNEGRRLQDYSASGDSLTVDVSHYSSGVYYLRVHTPQRVTIQKLIKR